MVNYANSVVYKIMSLDPEIDDIFVGSTTGFRKRKHDHKKIVVMKAVKNIIDTFTISYEIMVDGIIGRWLSSKHILILLAKWSC